jgi:putative FmdB family regulatory protein
MPIYAYRCAACGHDHEALQKISDAPLTVCPSCGASALQKQVTAAGFQLKGSGWYVTDFRNNGTAAAKNDKAGKPDTAPAAAESSSASTEGASAAPAAAPAPAAVGAPVAAASSSTPTPSPSSAA